MSARPAGLRLRLIATLTGAVLLAGALLAVPMLLAVRDALLAERLASLRREADALVKQVQMACGYSVSAVCAAPIAGGEVVVGRCSDSLSNRAAVICRELPGGQASLRLERPLAGFRSSLAELDAKLLSLLGLGLLALIVLLAWLLERGVVRRLRAVDQELLRVAAGDGTPELLPEGGDAVGNLEVAVRQLGLRLREERARTAAQIAELQSKNRELGEARAELARSERLASVGRLAAGVAHEVGNPISAVIGYLALVRDRLAARKEFLTDGKEILTWVEGMDREASRVDRILRDLLDLARPPPEQAPQARLSQVIASARASSAGIAVELDLPDGLPAVRGEEHYLAQVFVNLFANAARAGAKTVRIAARALPDAVEVIVRDDGRGVPPEHFARLFEPFFTTAAPGEGTGLGLALCHATMERFGGSIAAEEPHDGSGALFRLRFRGAA